MEKITLFFTLFISLLLISCAGCNGEAPSITLVNNGTGKADIQIKTSGGNTENINNIEPGTSSSSRTFDSGNIEFTISIQGVDEDVVYVLYASSCYTYVVSINDDNTVTSAGEEKE